MDNYPLNPRLGDLAIVPLNKNQTILSDSYSNIYLVNHNDKAGRAKLFYSPKRLPHVSNNSSIGLDINKSKSKICFGLKYTGATILDLVSGKATIINKVAEYPTTAIGFLGDKWILIGSGSYELSADYDKTSARLEIWDISEANPRIVNVTHLPGAGVDSIYCNSGPLEELYCTVTSPNQQTSFLIGIEMPNFRPFAFFQLKDPFYRRIEKEKKLVLVGNHERIISLRLSSEYLDEPHLDYFCQENTYENADASMMSTFDFCFAKTAECVVTSTGTILDSALRPLPDKIPLPLTPLKIINGFDNQVVVVDKDAKVACIDGWTKTG